MICKKCGKNIPDNSRYCAYCNEYVRNLDNAENAGNLPTEPVPDINVEAEIKEPQEKGKAGKIVAATVIVLLLVAVVIGIVFAYPTLKEKFKREEITTEPPEITIEATTVPPTTAPPVTDHFGEAKTVFYELSVKLGNMLGDPASDFSVTDETPEDNYGSQYAYNSRNNPGCVYIFTGSRNNASSRLKSVAGKINVILPGRANYTYSELKNILGDDVKYKETDEIYSVYYETDKYIISFFGPVNNSIDAALDSFTVRAVENITSATTAAPKTTVKSNDLVKTNPDEYFKNTADKKYTVTTKGDNLNVRSFAGTENKIVATVSNKEVVTVHGTYNGWAYISKADGTKGWVSENFIKSAE